MSNATRRYHRARRGLNRQISRGFFKMGDHPRFKGERCTECGVNKYDALIYAKDATKCPVEWSDDNPEE